MSAGKCCTQEILCAHNFEKLEGTLLMMRITITIFSVFC